MLRVPFRSVAIRRAVLALAGTALTSSFAYATTAPTPCQSLNGSAASLVAAEIDGAIGSLGPNTGTPLVLAVQAQDIPPNYLAPGVATPAVCQVAMVIASDGNPFDSQIQVAMLLPEGSYGTNSSTTWNGRFLGTGNGGFAGAISGSTLVLGIAPDYAAQGVTNAVANTDLGDGSGLGGPPNFPVAWYNCNTEFCGSAEGNALYGQTLGGLYGNPVAIADFGYGATHLMTLAGKEVVQLFYGAPANYSYFHGCSTGGQQALMEAQRFPADYNGILAGSPAYDRTHLHIASASFFETTHAPADGSGFLFTAGLALAHQAVLTQCAGTDGGYSGDNFLTLPAKCNFNAAALQCTGAPTEVPCADPNGTSCTCLLPGQVTSLNAAWTGALDNHGHTLYPGYERGVEDPAAQLIEEEEGVSEPLFDSLDYWAFGPSFTWQSLFADTTVQAEGMLGNKITALDTTPVGLSTFAGVLNANDANLPNSAFVANGGKLIMYAGYEDPLIPSASTIDYYNKMELHYSTGGGANPTSYARLYMAPGMWHCNGGPGANAFGNLSATQPPAPTVASDDIYGALTTWVEKGFAPTSIIATKYVNDDRTQGTAFQRPLCPYPETAKLSQKLAKRYGWQDSRAWLCNKAPLVLNQQFDPIYGPQ